MIYDNDNNMIKEVKRGQAEATLDTRGGGSLTDLHIVNFLDTIRGDAQPMAPIDEGHKSVLLCHLGNIAQHTGRTLTCDPATGRILDDDAAKQRWGRDYEPGWEPKG